MSQALIHLKNQIEAVASARGKIAKEQLIKQFGSEESHGHQLFKEVLNFVYNPHISTGIAKKKMNKELPPANIRGYYGLPELMVWIMSNNSGSDIVVATVQTWINQQPAETHELLKNIFTNDLQIGATEKSINAALGYELIPVWDVMLAHRWEKHEEKVNGKFFVTLKMDDYRCTVIFNDETQKWELKARSGLLYEGVVEIEEIFNQLPKDLVYDGGLLSIDDSLKSKERFRKTGKILKTDGPKRGLMFYIYDALPKSQFLKGKSELGYELRQKGIENIIERFGNFNGLFQQVPKLYEGDNKDQIMPLLEQVLEQEYEGLMVNTASGKYETKRSNQLLKVKEFYTVDLRVIDYYEYKHPGKLGGFICEYKDGNTVRVGGGFKLHEREEYWLKRDEMIGKIIEVRYFQESENQNGGKSIRHGHFMGLRWDKTEPSFD